MFLVVTPDTPAALISRPGRRSHSFPGPAQCAQPCHHPDSWKLFCIRADGKMRQVVILIFATTVLGENSQNCTADIYESIRDKYESCANDKILTITAQIQSSPLLSDQENIVCSAVKELINNCGIVLEDCFSGKQVCVSI